MNEISYAVNYINDVETYVRLWYDVSMQNGEKRIRRQIAERIRKADLVLVAVCMLAAVLVGVLMLMHRREGNIVRISCNGEILAEIVFEEAGTQRYFIGEKDGHMTIEACGENPEVPDKGIYNLLSIADGAVRMEAADCRDQICVRHRPVSAGGESIICLPHKLVVEIITDAGQDDPAEAPDGVVE